jgi:chitodextrinase
VQQGASVNQYNLLANPDFESGDANWVQEAANASPIVTSYLNPTTSNTRYAWLCGYDNCVDRIFQDVTIPSDVTSAALQFQYEISTEETNANVSYDKLLVSVFSPPTNPLASVTTTLSNVNAKSGWTTSQSLDLTALKGKTVRVQFSGTTDASSITSFYLDDIRLNVTGTSPDKQAPTVPAGLTARVNGPNSVGITWSFATDNVGISQYQIFRNAVFLKAVAGNVLSYNDLTVLPATSYAYNVMACDVAGNCSNASIDVKVTTGSLLTDAVPPSVPAGLKATALSQTSIGLSWTASTDNVAVVSYNLYRNGSLLTSITAGTSYVDSALTPTTYYSYSVAACDAAGNCSSQSLAVSTYTQSPPNLSPIVFSGATSFQVSGNTVSIKVNEIKNTSTTRHSGSLRLELWAFTAPYTGVVTTGYRTALIRTSAISGAADTLNPLASFSNISLNLSYVPPPSANNYFALLLTEFDTSSCTSADHFCSVNYVNYHESVPPTVPTLSNAVALNSAQIQLTWSPSTDASGVSNYKIYRNGTLIALLGNVTTYTDGGLAPSTSYSYTVAACDASQNCSEQSAMLSATTLAFQDTSPPTVPTGLVGIALSSTSVKLTWAASTDNIGVVNYKLYSSGVFVADLGNTLTTLRNNTAATQYNYSLSACDAAGNCSTASPTVSVTTPALIDSQPPSVPGSLSAKSDTPTTVTLSWAAATDNVAVSSYKVFRSNILLTNLGPVTSFEDSGLKPATNYVYKVQACDTAGNCSADSLSVSVVTKSVVISAALPDSPTGVVAKAGNGQATITFAAPSNNGGASITSYRVTSSPGGFSAVGTGSPLTVTGLTNGTPYTFTVTATNSAGTGAASSPSNSVTPTWPTTTISLVSGWNLIGNSYNVGMDVTSLLSDTANVTTVWKWLPNSTKWAFYAPTMTSQALADYVKTKGYEVLTTVSGGEGFWVNAKQAFDLQAPNGVQVLSTDFQSGGAKQLNAGWNLIAIGDNKEPSNFNASLSLTPPVAGAVASNVTTLWAWDAAASKWYFYAPGLEASGGLVNYTDNKGYLDFTTHQKKLAPGTGFWVNIP